MRYLYLDIDMKYNGVFTQSAIPWLDGPEFKEYLSF